MHCIFISKLIIIFHFKPEYQSSFDPIRYNGNTGTKKITSMEYIAMLRYNKNFSNSIIYLF